jgi:hypothetical protein
MAQVTSARATLGALFGTIQTTASTATSILDTAAKVVSIGENYVDQALQDQRDRMAADRVDSLMRISEEKALELTERRLLVEKYKAQSPVHASAYDANLKLVMDAITASRNGTAA